MKRIFTLLLWLAGLLPSAEAQIVSPGIALPGSAGHVTGDLSDTVIRQISPGIFYREPPVEEKGSGPYLGQTPPDTVPERFAPASLQANSQWFWHGSPAFSPGLDEMCFVKYNISTNKTEINYMNTAGGTWSGPARPSFSDTAYMENNPFFSLSGDTLYFYSMRPGGPYLYVTRQGDGWSAPESLHVPCPDSSSPGWDFFITRSGRFYSDIMKTGGSMDIYYSDRVNGQYTDPVRLGPEINTDYQEWGATLDSAERILIFASNRPGGYGYHDLYISYREGDHWTEAQNLGPAVNCDNEDGFPRLSPDDQYLFFTTAKNDDRGYNPYWVKARAVAPSLGINAGDPKKPGIGLGQNYPNPSAGKTTIGFSLTTGGYCRLSIFDLFGREIKRVAEGRMEAGNYMAEADLRDLEPGIYLYSLVSEQGIATKRMAVAR